MIKMPILLSGHTMTPAGVLRPLSMGQQWRADSLSSVTMELDDTSPEVNVGDWVQVYAPNGLSGVFYVKNLKQDKITKHVSVTMEHTMGLLQEMVVFGEVDATAMGGSGGTVPAGTAITYLLSKQTESLWTLYQNDFPAEAQGWKFTNSTIYADLNDVAGAIRDCQWEFDQSVLPWRLSLKAWPTDSTMEMRMNRNISTMKVTIDRSHMYTRCYPTGKNNLHIDSVNGGVSYLDRNTATWGVVAQVITDSSIKAPALLKAWAEKQLKRNAEPAVTVSISGFELSKATGESMDKIIPGRLCRVPLPRFGTTITERVTELNWKNVLLDEESVTVTLANEHKTIAGILNEKAGGGGGGGSKSNTDHDCQLGENEQKIEEFENSDIWINKDSIWNVCGSYTVTTDSQGRHIRLNDGALLEIKRDGIYETVGTAAAIEDVQDGVDTITGSALWTQRNGITGVCGEFDIVTDPVTGAKTLVIKSGGGMKIRRNNVEYGLYDAGNLTAGVMVDTINGDSQAKARFGFYDNNTLTAGVLVQKINGDATQKASLGFYDNETLTAGVLVEKINGDETERAALGFFDEGNLTAGFMIEKINGQSTAHINADNVYIGNQRSTTVISGKCELGDVTADYIAAKIATIPTLTGIAASFTGNVRCSSMLASAAYIGTAGSYQNLATGIKSIINEGTGNQVDLHITKFDGTESHITFSRATTPVLSGSWSGGVLTVSSNPAAAANYRDSVYQGALSWDGNVASGNIVHSTGQSEYATGATYRVDATARYRAGYNAGWAAARAECSVTYNNNYDQIYVNRPTETVDGGTERLETLTVSAGGLASLTNPAAHTAAMSGRHSAYLKAASWDQRKEVDFRIFSDSRIIS